jgi:hypothetical protein
VWTKPKPSVVQLLRLPGVAKMEAMDTRAAGMGCCGRSVGIGVGTVHRVGWDTRLHSACVGHRRGKVGPDSCCLWSGDECGACAGRGACIGRRWASIYVGYQNTQGTLHGVKYGTLPFVKEPHRRDPKKALIACQPLKARTTNSISPEP